MNISADFGITVTDTLRKKDGTLVHKMDPSTPELNHGRVKDIFQEIDFKTNEGFMAVTGGKHLELGDFIENTPIVHVNEIEVYFIDMYYSCLLYTSPSPRDRG